MEPHFPATLNYKDGVYVLVEKQSPTSNLTLSLLVIQWKWVRRLQHAGLLGYGIIH